eukprot:TRINITY_DN11219_c0_g1_i1.p1 TRINITY_DN11219_c0_g1~~TRINITY_DN11219_c0_g1_i1.p1  ORF type:complete len:489 (+),score=112.32 TRINITY_DN11219_c0_g1_i1:247-1713(+)
MSLSHIHVSLQGSKSSGKSNNSPKGFKLSVPSCWTVAHLRDAVALCCGVCSDLSEKLKLELQTTDESFLRGGRGGQHRRRNKKDKFNNSGFIVPLSNDAAVLSTLKMDFDEDVVNVSNWNKVGSAKKFEIAALLNEVLNSPASVDNEMVKNLYDAILLHQELSLDDHTSGSVRLPMGICSLDCSKIVFELLEALGFVVDLTSGEICVENKTLNKNRRVQLFMEIFRDFHSPNSAVKSVDYLDSFRPSTDSVVSPIVHSAAVSIPMLREDVRSSAFSRSLPIMDDSKDYPPSPPAASSPSLASSSSSSRVHFRTRGGSLPELDQDREWDSGMYDDDDFVLSSPSSSRNPRRRDRRRRRRERARILLSHYQSSDLGGEDDSHDDSHGHAQGPQFTYESLFELENVPVGINPDVLRMLPVQVLSEKDVLLLKGRCQDAGGGDSLCRICLGEYGAGEMILRLPCLHFYHKQCISKWLSANKKCPQDMIPVDI